MKEIEEALSKLGKFMISPAYRGIPEGVLDADVLNTNGCAYYQWTPHFIDLIKPSQVVELGGAMGVWDLMVLNGKYQDFKLYSITLPEHGLEFSYIVDKYPNFYPSLGDDLSLLNWPKDLDLNETDLWFFDSLHEEQHLRKELDLYSPYFKKGSIILFDDIHSFGLDPVWDDIQSGKWGQMECVDKTNPLHYSGFSICKYG